MRKAATDDRFANPLDLATALSAYLHPFDGHFTVVYRPNAEAMPGALRRVGPGPGQLASGPRSPLARQNYGFVHTEMFPGGIGYIAVNQFAPIDPQAPNDPARIAADAALQSVVGARAVILDLRDSRAARRRWSRISPAISFRQMRRSSIPSTARGAAGSEAPVGDPTGPRRLDMPLYILVNGGTGSRRNCFRIRCRPRVVR